MMLVWRQVDLPKYIQTSLVTCEINGSCIESGLMGLEIHPPPRTMLIVSFLETKLVFDLITGFLCRPISNSSV